MSLDLGALIGNVILETTAFDRAYARVVRKFSLLGTEAERAGAGTAKLDESLVTTSRAADKTSASLGRTAATTRTAATADERAAVAAKAHADAVARVTAVTNGSAAAGQRVVQSQLRLTASQERYDAVMASGAASTRQLAGAQATLIGSERSLAAASLAADRSVIASSKAAAAARRAYADSLVSVGRRMSHALTLPVVAAAVVATKMAGNFEFQMNRMVTAAGESRKNLKMVSDGVLRLMGSTGTSAKQLEMGLYYIESAGMHGAKALRVLDVAAQGAKIENADLATVANAVTSAMVDYHVKVGDSARVMNTLIAGVSRGKTTLGEMSHAFSAVGAAGALAKIPMIDLVAAIAEMTRHGTDAAKAGTYLRQTIGQLMGGSARARLVMKGLGIDANQVGLTMSSGPGGLAKAIGMVYTGLEKHLTPAGLVAIDVFKKSKGSLSDFHRVLGNIPPSLVTTFSALAYMTGGVKSLQGILQLGGKNAGEYSQIMQEMGGVVNKAGNKVEGMSSVQKTANQKAAELKHGLEALGIELGTVLLPAFKKSVEWVQKGVTWWEHLGSGWKKVIGIAALFLAALGPIVAIGGRLITVFGWLSRGATLLATPFTRLATTISETGATMGGLAARATESEAVMTRAVVTGSAEQQAALERLMVTQRLMAENAAATSGMVARSGAALGAGGAGMAGRAGAAGRAGRFGGIGGGAGMNAGMYVAVAGSMGYSAGMNMSGNNRAVGAVGAAMGLPAVAATKLAPAIADWLGLAHKMKNSVKDLFSIDAHSTSTVTSFAAALTLGGAALTANATAAARAALAHTGLVAAAAKGGLQEKDLTNAITGSNAAYNKVVATWKASGTASAAQLFGLQKLRDQFRQGGVDARKYADAHGLVIAGEMKSASVADFLRGKLGNLNKMHLTGAKAAQVFNGTVKAMTQSIHDNGKTLDGNTIFGQRNIAMIRHAAVSALAHAQAVYQQTHSLRKADGALESDRAALVRHATQAGLSKGEVDKLVKSIFGVKSKHVAMVVDTAAAIRDTTSFGGWFTNYITGLGGKHIAGPVIGAATGAGMRAGIGGLVTGQAVGTQAAFGQATIPPNTRFTVGEGASHTWEAGVTDSQGRASIFSNAQSKAMGIKAPTAYASGTVFRDLATMLPRGLANGIHEKLPEVRRAAGHMADATMPGFGSGTGGGGFAVQHQTVIHPAPGMSEREIGRAAAMDAVWQLQMIGGLPT